MSISKTAKHGLYGAPSGRTRNMIPKHKVSNFIKLIEAIRKKLGTYEETAKYCGFERSITYKMKDELFLTGDTARKILNAYNKLYKKAN